MTDPRPNGTFPIDEGDLLALIEGESLPGARAGAAAHALKNDAALASRVDAMRRDRADLRSLGAERAPAGLVRAVVASVEPAMERRMLLGLEQSAAVVEQRPPVSTVRADRPAVLASIFTGTSGRRLALAAGLTLVVGGGSVLVLRSGAPSTPTRLTQRPDQTPVIDTPPSADGAAGGTESSPSADAPHQPQPIRIASSGSDDPTPDPASAPISPEAAPVVTLAAHAPAYDFAGALRLARENRLMIVVRTRDVEATSGRLGSFTPRAAGWRVASDVPAGVLASLARERADTVASAPPFRYIPIDTDLILAMETRDSMRSRGMASRPVSMMPVALAASAPETPATGGVVHMIESRVDESALASIAAALAGGADAGVEFRFEALAEPLPATPVLTADAVFWWSRPPADWTAWASIPVVVERAE